MDDERAKILISYKLNTTIANKPKLIRDELSFWIESGNRKGGRFQGETPLVFIRQDLKNDLEVLDFANKLFIGLSKKDKVKNERDIIRLYERLKGDKQTWKSFEIKNLKRGFGDDDTYLKMPDYGYTVIKHDTFSKTAKDIQIDYINKNIKIRRK